MTQVMTNCGILKFTFEHDHHLEEAMITIFEGLGGGKMRFIFDAHGQTFF